VEETPTVSRKVIAVAVVVIIIAASVGAIWYFYFRHWSITEIEGQVISDPGPGSPGFKHSLAGRSVVVEGRVTEMTTLNTTLGVLTIVELDGHEVMPLRYWGSVGFDVGDRVERKVSFEWSRCNDERHVYSPQLAFPTIVPMYSISPVMSAIFYVYTYDGTFEISNEGPDVKTLITWIGEPIPLDTVNCTVRAGRGSYAADYVDALGSYKDNNVTDHMANLALAVGENGTVEFIDANCDNHLNGGDYFMLRNLTRPDTASGLTTYVMTLDWPPDPSAYTDRWPWSVIYYQLMNEGVIAPTDLPSGPVVRFHASDDGLAKRFTFDFVDRAIAWDDIRISLSCEAVYIDWYPASANFSEVSPHTTVFPGKTLGSTDVVLTCTDVLGDGHVQEGDYFTLEVAGGLDFQEDLTYALDVLHEGTGARLDSGARFRGGAMPLSPLSVIETQSGLVAEFSTVHNGTNQSYMLQDVCWDELMFVLSDGTNVSGLEPSPGFLLGSAGVPLTLGSFTLGSLSVVCRVTDLNGDGLVNRGDNVILTPLAPEGFPTSETYSLLVVYLPESSVMSSAEFTG